MSEPRGVEARRLLALPLMLAAAVAGCGGGVDKDEYSKQYRPINARLLDIGQDVGEGLETASGKSKKQLSEEFARYALRLQTLNTAIRRLEAPDELKDDAETLAERVDDVVDDLKALSGAAGVGDRQETAAAVVDFGADSNALNRAQNRMARLTGSPIGPK